MSLPDLLPGCSHDHFSFRFTGTKAEALAQHLHYIASGPHSESLNPAPTTTCSKSQALLISSAASGGHDDVIMSLPLC